MSHRFLRRERAGQTETGRLQGPPPRHAPPGRGPVSTWSPSRSPHPSPRMGSAPAGRLRAGNSAQTGLGVGNSAGFCPVQLDSVRLGQVRPGLTKLGLIIQDWTSSPEFSRVSSVEFGYNRPHSGRFGCVRACSATSSRARFSSKSGWHSGQVGHIRLSPASLGCSAMSDRCRSVRVLGLLEKPLKSSVSEFPLRDVTRRGGTS